MLPLRASVLSVALLVLGTGCGSVEPPATTPDTTPVQTLPAIDALGVATSPCGRYELRLVHAAWSGEPHEQTKLELQMQCDTGDDDVFLCMGPRITDLVSAQGTEWREKGLGGRARADGRHGSVLFHGLEQYERADSVRRLRVECHVMRVMEWRTYDIECRAPDAAEEYICPPYHVGVSGDPDTCHVSAYCTDDWKSFPAKERDLFLLIGHDWVASGVELTDATGEPLQNWGANGSGGATVAMYGPPMFPNHEPGPIRYPVSGTLRLPARYVVEIVPFEFVDVSLVREQP